MASPETADLRCGAASAVGPSPAASLQPDLDRLWGIGGNGNGGNGNGGRLTMSLAGTN